MSNEEKLWRRILSIQMNSCDITSCENDSSRKKDLYRIDFILVDSKADACTRLRMIRLILLKSTYQITDMRFCIRDEMRSQYKTDLRRNTRLLYSLCSRSKRFSIFQFVLMVHMYNEVARLTIEQHSSIKLNPNALRRQADFLAWKLQSLRRGNRLRIQNTWNLHSGLLLYSRH